MAVLKQEKQNIENPNPLGKSDDRMKLPRNSVLTKMQNTQFCFYKKAKCTITKIHKNKKGKIHNCKNTQK
jgi:hypothetical protein